MTAKPTIVEIYPLTPLQKGMLFHALLEPGSAVYFQQLRCRFEGDLDPEVFTATWRALIERHPALRSAFVTKGQKDPVQVVFDQAVLPVVVDDWRGLTAEAQTTRLDSFLEQDRKAGFAFNRAPLMRVSLFRQSDRLWQMVWSHHHLLLDGWSQPLLLREFFALYRAHRHGLRATLPAVPAYGDYLGWLRRQDMAAAEAFWRRALDGFEAPTPLGIDTATGIAAAAPPDIAYHVHRLPAAVLERAKALARDTHVTLNTVVQAAWAFVLGCYAGSDDVAFGVTIAGRPADLPGADRMVGLFINTLPLRLTVDGTRPVSDWLGDIQIAQADLQRHGFASLTDIQGWSPVPRGEPLFHSLYAFENFPLNDPLPATDLGFAVHDARLEERTNYPLTLVVVPGEEMTVKVAFDANRIPATAAEALPRHLIAVLEAMARDPHATVSTLSLLDTAPALASAGVTAAVEEPVSLATAFADVVRRFPDRIAISDGDACVTYAELERRATALAHRLTAHGVGPDQRVGICLDRSIDLVAAMLAVASAGGAYVPLDPAYPADRLAYILDDSGALVTVTSTALAARLSDACPLLCLDVPAETSEDGRDHALAAAGPDDAAYVIYTSGSTGQPKGVVVTQRNTLRLFSATRDAFGFDETDVWSFFHSFSFDFSVWELWGALLFGGRIAVVPWAVSRDPDAFLDLLVRERVTVLNQTPSAFNQLIVAEGSRATPPALALRSVIFGGEALAPAMLEPWLARHGDRVPTLVNMYGITETTVHVTYRVIRSADLAHAKRSVIGLPIADLYIRLLDRFGHPVPTGIAGEICVGGAGVARGYLNRQDLTAERFVKDRYSDQPGARLYKSGDLGRTLPDGEIEYLGRMDHQVKVRGFRIEPGEIEATLTRHPAIAQALVMAPMGPIGRRLVAWLVLHPGARPGIPALHAFLRERLPDHMIPEAFVPLDAFPLTINGKIDRAALPQPDTAAATGSAEPQTPTEKTLAGIWAEVLALPRVGIDDDYFALGGDSIRSIRVAALARERHVGFKLQRLFEQPTIRRLAATIDGDASESAALTAPGPFGLLSDADRASLEGLDLEDAYPLTRLQAGMVFHADFDRNRRLYQDLFTFRLRLPVDAAALLAVLGEVVAEQPLLRTGFDLDRQGEPLQLVRRTVALPVTITDLRDLATDEQNRVLADHVADERRRGYDARGQTCWRIGVFRLAEDQLLFSVGIHHAILDGWSVATLMSTVLQRYLHRLGRPVGLPPAAPAGHFRDFVALERAAIQSQAARAYWLGVLKDLPVTTVPALPSNPAAAGGAPRLDRVAGAARSARLSDIARTAKLPIKSLLLAVHLRTLALLSGEEEVGTGLVVNGRPDDRDSTRVLGLFLNTVPLRLTAGAGRSWLDLARAAMVAEVALMPHRRLPLPEIRRLGGNRPVFETSFNFVHFHVYQGIADLRDVTLLETTSFDEIDIPFSVSFSVDATGGGLRYSLAWDPTRYGARQMACVADLYAEALAACARDPNADVTQTTVPWPPMPEAPWPLDSLTPVHESVIRQARTTPDATAVRMDDRSWRYRDLDLASARLAHRLTSLGAGPERPVALHLERSFAMVVAMLAALRAGAPYVPLDRDYPKARRAQVLAACRPAVVVGDGLDGLPLPAGTSVIEPGQDTDAPSVPPRSAVHGDSLAYLIYTSGSTGTPKGVAVPHRALANHMRWFLDRFPLGPDDVVLQKTPVMFDASVWEVWAPLMAGAELRLAPPGSHRDPEVLVAEIVRGGVTVLQVVPSLLGLLTATPGFAACRSLRRLFSGGELLSRTLVDQVATQLGLPVVNLYGPTETTIQCSARQADGFEAGTSVTLGDPLPHVSFHILDDAFRPVPVGVAGELHVGGACLARGYWGAPDLTAERFIPDPFGAAGTRLYRTGDRVRRLPDGGLEYLGRVDEQVKLRGHRVEIGEVEARLSALPQVRRAVAGIIEGPEGAPRLAAWVEVDAGTPWQTAIDLAREALRAALPDYMVPALFQPVTAWPVLPNGKVDRLALPRPQAPPLSGRPYRAPAPGAEAILAAVWHQVLAVDRVGANDDFFALGGDSILSLQVVARARAQGLALSVQDAFRHPTLSAMAAAAATVAAPTMQPIAGEVPLTPAQRWFFDLDLARPQHWNQSVLLEVDAGIDADRLASALQALVARHDVFRLRFTHQDGVWRQRYDDGPTDVRLERMALSGNDRTAALTTHAETVQGGLDLTAGPLFRAVLYQFDEGPNRLFLACHHLIVDGVSWRLLLADLAVALEDPKALAPTANAAFGHWTRGLATAATGPGIQAQRPFWTAQTAEGTRSLPLDTDGSDTEDLAKTVETTLDRRETDRLLRAVPATLRASAFELLTAVLVDVLTAWTGGSAALIEFEGHGREDIVPGADVAGTVGWFTALHPLRLEPGAGRPAERLGRIKQQLRAVPDGGIGFGLLRYATDAAALADVPPPQVAFNYLGQFDGSLDADGPFRPAPEPVGAASDPTARRVRPLDVVAMIVGGRLVMRWVHGARVLDGAGIAALADGFMARLRVFLDLDAEAGRAAWTPDDFPLAGLDAAAMQAALGDATDVSDLYPLGPAQEGMLFHTLNDEAGSGVYVQQVTGRMETDLPGDLLARAWQTILDAHPALRVSFAWAGLPRPMQRVHAGVVLPVTFLDWGDMTDEQADLRLAGWLAEDRRRGFTLTRPPLMRLALIRLSGTGWRFVWSHHHLLLDGWSLPLVFRRVLEAGEALARHRQPELPDDTGFRRHIARLTTRDGAADEAFWRDALANCPEPTFPLGNTKSPVQAAPTPRERSAELDAPALAALTQAARAGGVSLSTLVNAAWSLVLAAHAGETDVIYGVTVSGRPADLDGATDAVGMFINTLPLRVPVDPTRPLADWLADLHARLGGLVSHQDSRLLDVQSWSGRPRGTPLFEAILVYENYPVSDALRRPGGHVRVADVQSLEQNNYPLSLYAMPGNTLRLSLCYDAGRIDDAAAGDLLDRTLHLLTQLGTGTARTPAELAIVPSGVTAALLSGGAAQGPVGPIGPAVVLRIAATAAAHPDKLAVVAEDGTLTYAALERRAEAVATRLRTLGIGPDVTVGVHLNRGAHLLPTLVGIHKAGGAYIPLDPAFPADRLAMMIDDGRPRVLVTERALAATLPPAGSALVVAIEDIPDTDVASDDVLPPPLPPHSLAYVLFTSGSTGRPKGVAIDHASLANCFDSFAKTPGLSSEDVLVAVTTLSFDIAALELLLPGCVGATVVLASQAVATDGRQLADLLERSRATLMQATPATWRLLLAVGWRPQPGFRAWIGGEAVTEDLAGPLLARGVRIWNVYGPTETTIWSTARAVANAAEAPQVGGPVRNTRLSVVDVLGRPAPVGVPGELVIGGAGLARGYYGRPDLTAERFVPDPDPTRPGERLYQTGDLAQWRHDGTLRWLRRIDTQTKIRGYRIELGEVEAALNAQDGIEQAVVVVAIDQRGENRLVANLLWRPGAALSPPAALREALLARLPSYMVPTVWRTLEALPLTENRKVDRKRLSAMTIEAAPVKHAAPRDPLEQAVATIWQELFEMEAIGIHDDFFELGGHSLTATRLHARLTRVFKIDITLREFLGCLTVARTTELIRQRDPQPGQSDKIALAYLKLQAMSEAEKAARRSAAPATKSRGSETS
jgi:amino acid adenylation domain-containing protein/non-ribosomal peptide synthase protein (TIGR01720 family)